MDVDLSSQIAAFNEFFTSVYKSKIDDLLLVYPTQKSLFISYAELEKFDPDLADALVHTPDIIRDAAEEAMKQLNRTITTGKQFAPNVRFTEFPTDTMLIEQLSSKNINELVAFKAVVTKRAEVMHRVKIATYKCELCDAEVRLIVGKNFTPPKRCDTCKKFALKQIDEDSTFTDIQRAEVQELLEKVRGGAPAAHIELLLEDDLVNKVAPGDNIEVAGIMRLRPPLKMKQKQEMVYSRFVEVNSVASLKRDFEEIDITKEDEHRIRELATNPTITNIVTKSIAPSIYGHNEVKLALALQLFGGTHGKTMKGGMPIRDDIHVLLIGDPGIAKCTDGDSKVLLADGSVAKIRDIVEEVLREKGERSMDDGVYAISNHDVVSMNLCGRTEHSKATHFWKLEAPEYLYKVETASGKDVRVTPEHPFFVPLNGYIKPKAAKELAAGDFIATPHYIKVDGKPQLLPKARRGKTNANRAMLPETLDGEFARLLGYLAGDGYLRRTTSYEINFTNSDDDLLDDFSQILRGFALDTGKRYDKESTAKTVSAFSVELGQILENLGMMKDSFGKTVPQIVMKSPDMIVKEFIKAYFDCEASVGKEGLVVVSASRELLGDIQLLLLRFGITSQLHPTYGRATNAKNHKLTKYHRMFILGENAARYEERISFTSKDKVRKLKQLGKKFNTNIDVVPGLTTILKETRESLGIRQFDCGVPRSTYQHFERGDRNPSYGTLRTVVDAFTKSLRAQAIFPDGRLGLASHNISVLETLCKSHIFWDKVKNIRKVKPTGKWVYDLQVDSCHNFIANNLIIHNSRFLLSVSDIAPKSIYVSGKSVSGAGLTVSAEKDELGEGGWTLKAGALVLASGGTAQVDEFDKIKEEDTAALHEAMETQSYHYSTKLMRSDGREVKIGEFVEGMMGGNPEKVIVGHDCLILRDGLDDVRLLTTDFSKIYETVPYQISKHKAPSAFIKVVLQTGRELLVTPEHPFWIVEDGIVKTKAAEALTAEDYTLMPRHLPLHNADAAFRPELLKVVGYHITDGGYELNRGAKNGINFYNKDEDLIEDYSSAATAVFGIAPYFACRKATGVKAARLISVGTLKSMAQIHPSLIEKGAKKIIPPQFMSAPSCQVAGMLRAMFDSDGTFSGHYISLIGENRTFIGQVQILLLRFGIRTHILRDGDDFRLTITGPENIRRYHDHIGFLSKKKRERLETYLKSPGKYRNTTDVVPGCSHAVFHLLNALKISEHSILGFGLSVQKKGYSFTRRSFGTICARIREKFEGIRDAMAHIGSHDYGSLIKLRKQLGFSQYDIEGVSGIKRATLSYWECKKINIDTYRSALKKLLTAKLALEREFGFIERFAIGDVGFVAIRKVERIENTDQEWVYDVTVQPSQAFVSECAVLHNTISVAKAGIVAKFRTKTAILAAANPKYGRFDQSKNLADQFAIPPTLLSRFDLIFPIVDVLDEEKDSKLAEHILSTHMGTEVEDAEVFDKVLLRKYISYARRRVSPKLTNESSRAIKEFYVELRRGGRDTGSVAITPRYLEGLVRLAEAHAKIRLSETVDEGDSKVAIDLFKYVMQQIMTDKATGKFDVDVVATGRSKTEREKLEKVDTIMNIIREHLRKSDTADIAAVVSDAASYEIDEATARKLLAELLRRGEIYEKEHGHIRIVGE